MKFIMQKDIATCTIDHFIDMEIRLKYLETKIELVKQRAAKSHIVQKGIAKSIISQTIGK